MKKADLFFRLGNYTLIVTAGLHLLGHFYRRDPVNQTEANLLELMQYEMNVGGLFRSTQQVLGGFSLSFAVLLIYVGLLNQIAAGTRSESLLLRVTILNAGFCGIMLGVSIASFPLPPIALFGIAFPLFLASLVLQKATAAEAAPAEEG
jgi:hypothetical protein